MGSCMSSSSAGEDDGLKQSKAIEKGLREDERRLAKEVKILLLGAGESGKTTVLKQMKLLHDGGFSPVEREHYRQQVFVNLIGAMDASFEAMARQDVNFDDSSLVQVVPMFEKIVDLQPGTPFPSEYHEVLRRLWEDKGVQTVVRNGGEHGLPENMQYFFPNLDRLFDPKYSPTEQDVLQTRGKTTGITETSFQVGDLRYRMFDVGGQRSERRKWIHCFDKVTAVLFLVAISGYDQCLIEDKEANQMQEALVLWDSICNSKYFLQTSMILFLNKIDLFKAKLRKSPISRHFPDYEGNDADYEAARAYFKMRFVRLNRSDKKDIYTHATCATDTNAMRVVMASVTDIIITRNLQDLVFH